MKRYTLAIGIVSGLAGILTFANPAAALTPRGCSGALAAGSAPFFKITGTGIGVKLRGEPLTNTSNWEKGIPDGASFRLLAQTSGDPTGTRANTVWNFVQLADGRQGYIADAWATTPGVANQYYNAVPRCGTATTPAATTPAPAALVATFTANGTVMGVVTNPAHGWGACEVIDYNVGLSGYPWGWFLRSRIPGGTYYVIRTGFWNWYKANDGINRLGCPTGDEYAYGNGARQNFQNGILQWNNTGTTFVPNPAAPALTSTYSLPLQRSDFAGAIGNLSNQDHAAGKRWAVDLMVREGAPVLSMFDGVVVWSVAASAKDNCGNGTIVRRELDGLAAVYCHGSTTPLPVGTRVRAGDTLMKSGNTGASGAPHLHVEIRISTLTDWDMLPSTPASKFYCVQPVLRAMYNGTAVNPFGRSVSSGQSCAA
jgi:Peptidase family M23/LGFP repeat